MTAVRAELEDLGITDQELSQAGLRITTTVDPVRQRAAVEAAHAGLAGQPVNLRSAMVAVDPATGGVLAYYGGDNGTGLDYARVRRLAGSTFKPFVVLAGLRETPPVGLGETFDGAARPGLRNAEGAECARCDLKQAMTVSNNVVFHTVARRLGPEKVADAARAAGITAPLDHPDEGIALGNKEVSTLELASAYATIAGGGVWHPPHLVSQVVTADGRVLYQASPDGRATLPRAGGAQRHRGHARGGRPRRARAGAAAGRREDGHGAVALPRREQRRVDGRVHPAARRLGVDGHRPELADPHRLGRADQRPDAARRGVAGVHGRGAERRSRRVVPSRSARWARRPRTRRRTPPRHPSRPHRRRRRPRRPRPTPRSRTA